MAHIPFNTCRDIGREMEYVRAAIAGRHVSGDGPFTKRCGSKLEQWLGAQKALLTTSCTHALEMAALLLDLQPGDEVIVPSFTFVSTVNAFVLRGAVPIFCDIRPDTLNMDERLLEGLTTTRTKAVIPVHYAGVGCEMDEIVGLTSKRGIAVIEDNAHGLLGKYRGRYLGTFGCMAAQSFHETKNFSCGEGGAILLNDSSYIERGEIVREKGTNRSRFLRGQVDRYTWVDLGSSYLISDLLAAFLYGQLEQREIIQSRRRTIWEFYFQNLREWSEVNGVKLPFVPSHCEQSYHMFYLLMPSLEERTRFIEHMEKHDIKTVFHYVPLNRSPMAARFGPESRPCPVTESISDRLVRLPFYNTLTDDLLQQVCGAVCEFVCRSAPF
jgi:dTDP-4-amino-4,6-dideoxygalactose transaminase